MAFAIAIAVVAFAEANIEAKLKRIARPLPKLKNPYIAARA